MSEKRWETRRLETWDKAKAMRAKFENSIVEAEGQKVKLAQGNDIWTMGFPAIRIIEDNPVGAMMAFKSEAFARQSRGASEIMGTGREVCGYQLNCWGSMFLDRLADGSKFPRRDLVIPMPSPCDQHTKRAQVCQDFNNIPRWQCDSPLYTDPRDLKRDKAMFENYVACRLDQIEGVERVMGQKFDDEVLVDTIRLMLQYQKYAAEVVCFNQHIPAPLSQKDLYSFYTLGGLTRTNPEETLDLWRTLRDEVKWRVENNIAAVATERYRWLGAHPPPWHFLKYYRYMEKYGAVCIGSQYTHGIGGWYEFKEDGTYGPRKSPLDLGWPLKTREDAMKMWVYSLTNGGMQYDDIIGPQALLDMARAYKVNGAILPLWRSGVGCVYGRREQGLALSEAGYRVMYFEGSQPGDRTDLDENRLIDQLDVWMEGQGLRKLED